MIVKPILICFALEEEAEPLPWKVWGWRTINILITGIGRKNAEKSVRIFWRITRQSWCSRAVSPAD